MLFGKSFKIAGNIRSKANNAVAGNNHNRLVLIRRSNLLCPAFPGMNQSRNVNFPAIGNNRLFIPKFNGVFSHSGNNLFLGLVFIRAVIHLAKTVLRLHFQRQPHLRHGQTGGFHRPFQRCGKNDIRQHILQFQIFADISAALTLNQRQIRPTAHAGRCLVFGKSIPVPGNNQSCCHCFLLIKKCLIQKFYKPYSARTASTRATSSGESTPDSEAILP